METEMDAMVLFQAAGADALPIVTNAATGQLEHEKFALMVKERCEQTVRDRFNWREAYTDVRPLVAPRPNEFWRTTVCRVRRTGKNKEEIIVKVKRVSPKSRDPDAEFNENMFEAHFMERIGRASHKNIMRLLAVYAYARTREIYMELEDCGAPLTTRLERHRGRMPIPLAAWYFRQALAALAYVHSRKIIHCDVKGDNLFVRPDGTLRLGDFGMSQECGVAFGPVPWNPRTINPRGYMPYELLVPGSRVTCAVDVYALGCVFVCAIAGEPVPFNTVSIEDQLAAIALFSPGAPNATRPPVGLALFNGLDPEPPLADLLSRMLLWDQSRRIVAAAAHEHEFFYTVPPPDSELFK
jgi:serine/threonine protein kinase